MLLVANPPNLRLHGVTHLLQGSSERDTKKFNELFREILGTKFVQHTHEDNRLRLLTRLCTMPLIQGYGHVSHRVMERLEQIDLVLGTHGVESFLLNEFGEDMSGSGSDRDVKYDIQYCNAGDTYLPTILYWRHKFWIGDWGSIVERCQTRKEVA